MSEWLSVADVIALHEKIMTRMGWAPAPLRDEGGLESAVMRPRMAEHYEEADIARQASLLAVGISQAQAFVDGNKRTGYAALEVFLLINGWRITVDSISVARELERVAEATNRANAGAAFEGWLRAHVEPVACEQ